MRQKFKTYLCYLTIIVLLPYIITAFINGPSMASSSNINTVHVKVKTDAGIIEISMEEYCIGILAKEIPADYKIEALKAQAILVRTEVYARLKEGGQDAELEEGFWTREQMEEAWGAVQIITNFSVYGRKQKDKY